MCLKGKTKHTATKSLKKPPPKKNSTNADLLPNCHFLHG